MLPLLVLFLLLPVCLLAWHMPFYVTLLASTAASVVAFFALKFLVGLAGVRL